MAYCKYRRKRKQYLKDGVWYDYSPQIYAKGQLVGCGFADCTDSPDTPPDTPPIEPTYQRWVTMMDAYECYNGDKYYKLKLQVSSDNIIWTDANPPEYKRGDLMEELSADCGATNPEEWRPYSQVCIKGDLYEEEQLYIYGEPTGELRIGKLVEKDSNMCVDWKVVPGEYICEEKPEPPTPPTPPEPPTPPQVETGFLQPISMDCYIYFPLCINPSGSGGVYTYCGYCELNGNILTIKKYKAYANGNTPIIVTSYLNSGASPSTLQPFNTEIGERYNISQYSLDTIQDIKYEISVDNDKYTDFEIHYKGNYFYFTNNMYGTLNEDMAYFLMNGQCDNSYKGNNVQVDLSENGHLCRTIKTYIFDDKTFEVMYADDTFPEFTNFGPYPSKNDLKNYNAYIQNGALSLMTIETK